jgi:hypothetical protein
MENLVARMINEKVAISPIQFSAKEKVPIFSFLLIQEHSYNILNPDRKKKCCPEFCLARLF